MSETGFLPGALEPRAVARQVVEQDARLVLLRVEPGEPQQPSPVVARLDDLRMQQQAHLVARRDELDLLDVEAELVQPAQALLEAVALAEREHLVARQLVPQLVVRRSRTLAANSNGSSTDLAAELRREVVQLAGEVLLGDVEVVLPLAVGQPLVQLARLGVDEVRGERAGVAPEERVRERAVAPEEAGEVQPDEQLRRARRGSTARAPAASGGRGSARYGSANSR